MFPLYTLFRLQFKNFSNVQCWKLHFHVVSTSNALTQLTNCPKRRAQTKFEQHTVHVFSHFNAFLFAHIFIRLEGGGWEKFELSWEIIAPIHSWRHTKREKMKNCTYVGSFSMHHKSLTCPIILNSWYFTNNFGQKYSENCNVFSLSRRRADKIVRNCRKSAEQLFFFLFVHYLTVLVCCGINNRQWVSEERFSAMQHEEAAVARAAAQKVLN